MIKIFHKYPKIKILGDKSNEGILTEPGKVVIEEKVDGANFGFYVKDDIIWFCSHNSNLTNSVQIAETGIPKWRGIKPVLTSWQNDPTKFNPNYYYFGESLQKHTITYDDIPGFIGFDVLDIEADIFFNWEIAQQIYKDLNLPFINVIHELDTNKEIPIKYLKTLYEKSEYKTGSAEGIVIKRYDTQLMAKIVDDEFKEQNKEVFGHTITRKLTSEDKIVETFCTPARIKKIIYKLHDDGNELEMEMMKILYKPVVEDMLEEEILNIYHEYNIIDFKVLNKLVSKECAKTLKTVIMNE